MTHSLEQRALRSIQGLVLFAALALGASALAATAPSYTIVSPQNGATVTSPVALDVDVHGAKIGRPIEGLDHLHISVDGGPEMAAYKNQRFSVPLDPGKHTLSVELAGPTHEPLMPAKSVSFTVR